MGEIILTCLFTKLVLKIVVLLLWRSTREVAPKEVKLREDQRVQVYDMANRVDFSVAERTGPRRGDHQ